MRSSLIFIGVLAAAVASSRCGGGGSGSNQPPTSPGTNTPTPVTVTIVATNGNKSYSPNPVATAAGEQIVFKNSDTAVHHIVMDNGSVDFGTLSPGGSSQAKAVGTGGNFHCANHPSMVGSINGAVAPDPPPGSGDGY
jgi:plastocyanin